MTGTELSTSLGIRLDDTAESLFTAQVKVDAINSGLRTVVDLVDNKYLTELETIANNISFTNGVSTYANAFGTTIPIRNGIIGIYNETNDKWCNIISPSEVQSLDNAYLSGTTTSPIAYTFNEYIYVKPTTISSVDIWYVRNPSIFNSADATSMASECNLNLALEGIVLDLAESRLWRLDGKLDRSSMAYNNALNAIQLLNDRKVTDLQAGGAGR